MNSRSDARKLPKVAIVGRPNVGKSTLFNRILGRREAIVLDRPGVTRDRLERICRLDTRVVRLEDTGGILPDAEEELFREVTRQAMVAIEDADVVVFVTDARSGVTPLDERVAESLRTGGKPVVVVANKVDVAEHEPQALDAWRLGLGEPVGVSAEHGRALEHLLEEIESRLPDARAGEEAFLDFDFEALPDPEVEVHVAIVGRPNVGKSSLVNRLLGNERVTVSAKPGTTRDAIDVPLLRNGRRFVLVDTAGIRRNARVETRDESIGILMTRRRLARAHVAIIVVDAVLGVTSQDQAVVGEVIDARRPFVIALNKWDLVLRPEEAVKELDRLMERKLAFAPSAPRVTISALDGQRVFKLLDIARELVAEANVKIPTAELNRVLRASVEQQQADGGSAPSALYITQIGTLPPLFAVFCRDPKRVPESFRRFVEGRIRAAFGLERVPVSVLFKDSRRKR